MKTGKLIQSLAACAISITFASGAFAMDSMSHQRDSNSPLGTPAQGAQAARVIKLGPGSKYLNVYRDEVVTIVNGEKAFTWRFDTLGTPSFELAKIAPRDFGAGLVRVYVATDLYEKSC
jgi:hypothetical protein